MVYSSAVSSVFLATKDLLQALSPATDIHVVSRRIETSDPAEINEDFLIGALGLSKAAKSEDNVGPVALARADQPLFAKPRGPVRRR